MPGPPACGFALMSMNMPPAMGKWYRCLVGGKAKGKYPDKKILVLPGQVLQPEAKGGVTPYSKPRELKSVVLGHTALSNRPQ